MSKIRAMPPELTRSVRRAAPGAELGTPKRKPRNASKLQPNGTCLARNLPSEPA
jgi:hypothetical protein